jgi:hypothetical protein
MKTINRMALGTISSLLLSAGLTKAAQKLDPLTNSVARFDYGFNGTESPANTCVSPCFFDKE